jgi:hypothetical protein
MALEIKILDYGDIELESSFLVLGRDCGRTRRVLTLGFLIVGGPYPIVVDTGYRSNQIMETLGMRGLQFHENMIENQLARHGVRMGDVRFVCHTHLHIDHAGKDDLFPMNTTVVLNRKELEYSVSGLMHPQYPAPDIKHLIDRLHTKSALRFLDLEITGPVELIPGVYCEAANAHTEGEREHTVGDEQRIHEGFRRSAGRHQLADRLRGEAVPFISHSPDDIGSDVEQGRENAAHEQGLPRHRSLPRLRQTTVRCCSRPGPLMRLASGPGPPAYRRSA